MTTNSLLLRAAGLLVIGATLLVVGAAVGSSSVTLVGAVLVLAIAVLRERWHEHGSGRRLVSRGSCARYQRPPQPALPESVHEEMRSARVACLGPVAVALVCSACTGTAAANVACGPSRAHTELQRSGSRVWSHAERYGRVFAFGCRRGHRSHRLGEIDPNRGNGLGFFALAGRYAAYADSSFDFHYGDAAFTVSVVDLVSGHRTYNRRLGRAAVEADSIVRVLVDSRGHPAFSFSHTPQAAQSPPAGATVIRDRRCGAEIVADSPDLAPASLRLIGRTIQWRQANGRHSAELCP